MPRSQTKHPNGTKLPHLVTLIQTELGRGGDNLFAEDVLPCVEHQLADLQVGRVDGADVDHLDVGVSGETLIAWF